MQESMAQSAGEIKAILAYDNVESFFDTVATHTAVATMYSIHAVNEEGHCNIHFLNVQKTLVAGTYVTNPEIGVRVAAVCFLENMEQWERIVSESGELTIDEISPDRIISGDFKFVLKGSTTGKKFTYSGKLD